MRFAGRQDWGMAWRACTWHGRLRLVLTDLAWYAWRKWKHEW